MVGTENMNELKPTESETGAAVVLQRLVSLRERLWARSENAYCDMIGIARKDESLGWEIKVERGQFGRKELDAHCAGGEKLGRHRALAEACREIDELLKQANSVFNKPVSLNERTPLTPVTPPT